MATPNLALIPSGYKAQKVYSVLPTNGDGDFTFARTGSATRVNENGLIETVANDVPRLDYSDGGCPSLLLEPQRTNLITYSEDFSQSDWTKSNSSITSNSVISPNGILNGSTLTDNTANTIHRLRDSVSLSASTDYSLSIFAKKGTLSNIQLALINTANSNTASRVFDLENGALGENITSGGTLSDSKITDYGNGWYRCEIIAQLGSTPNTYQITLATQSSGNSSNVNQVTYDGDGNGNVHLWGAMLEQSSYPTSYIPTQGGVVTRLADECEQTPPSGVIGQTELTIFYQGIVERLGGNDGHAITLSQSADGTGSSRVLLYRSSSNGNMYVYIQDTTAQFSTPLLANSNPQINDKYAIAIKDNDLVVYCNGVKVSENNSGTIPATQYLILNKFSNEINHQNKIKEVKLYNTRLSNSELAALTSN